MARKEANSSGRARPATASIQPLRAASAYTLPLVNRASQPLPRRTPPRLPAARRWLAALLLAALALPAAAQETVIPKQNVRTAYAQVLRVEPVFQTLTATRMEQHCDDRVVPPRDPPRGLSRIVGAVRQALTHDAEDPPPQDPPAAEDCRLVPVQRQFRRPIAYDVDYLYRGMKYRSRLPYDPGNRLRVQFSLQPVVPGEE